MFSLGRKIGTGTTSRRRPARECKVGIEKLDTRAVPAIALSAPGSPIVESGLLATLNVSFDEHGHGSAAFTHVSPLTPGGTITTVAPLATNLVAGVPVNVPGVTGAGTANPLTLAYHLPTAVNPGDVAIVHFQTGEISDVIRFTDAVNPATNSVEGWALVYSDVSAANPADSPADTGIPANFNPFSPLNGVALEFGVEGLDLAEYHQAQTVGQGPEQASYSFLSDGNLIPTTGG